MIKRQYPDAWIQTYCGIRFWPVEPEVSEILLPDIAHALAAQTRFTGHTRVRYSIAQHSVLTSHIVEILDPTNITFILGALLHDSAESYLNDISRPVKYGIPLFYEKYIAIEKNLSDKVAERFGLPAESLEIPFPVKKADMLSFALESKFLMAPLHPNFHINSDDDQWCSHRRGLLTRVWDEKEAEQKFLERFNNLWGWYVSGVKE